MKYPYSPLLSIFASNEGSILSPKAIDEKGKGLAQHPVGTGPYTFKSWKPGEEIRLEKNKIIGVKNQRLMKWYSK